MAQTKSTTSRSSSTSKSKSRSGSQRAKTSSPKSSASTRGKRTTSSRSSSTPKRRSSTSASSSRRSGGSQNQSAVGSIAARAKGPAMAGGAALVGLAGGLALSHNKRRNGILGRIPTPSRIPTPTVSKPKLSMPKVKPDEALKTIGKAAGEVAQRSERIGAVASEVQKASDALEKRR
jgi:hypothetical protein